MTQSESFQNKAVAGITYLYIILFVYAAVSKLLDFENFQFQLAQSPLLSAYAAWVSFGVIGIELILSILLIFKNTKLMGLYGSTSLMTGFTIYIYLILNFSEFVPCSCGGILEKLGWTEHLIFNIVFVLLGLVGIWLLEKQSKTNPIMIILKSVGFSLVFSAIVVFLFFSSEHIIKKENPFIRRFIPHAVAEEKAYDLGYNSYYFSGYHEGQIYLGNYTTPLVLTVIDTAFCTERDIKFSVENSDHPFRNLLNKVKSPYVYIYDGSVPVIYRGNLKDSVATMVSFADGYFTQMEIVDSARFIINTKSAATQTRALGLLDLSLEPKVKLDHNLLKKQIDGIFDTDGFLVANSHDNLYAYVFYYRNEIPVFDNELNLMKSLHTIDTITKAQIKVKKLSNGTVKMEAPPLRVNETSVLYKGILLNQSNLMGKYESKDIWEISSVIDLYNIHNIAYLGSFFIQHRGKNEMNQMLVTDNDVYVLSGTEIVRYRLAQAVRQYFKEGKAENPSTK